MPECVNWWILVLDRSTFRAVGYELGMNRCVAKDASRHSRKRYVSVRDAPDGERGVRCPWGLQPLRRRVLIQVVVG